MLGLAFVLALAIARPIRVVTTIPDLADWVRNVSGDRVVVSSLLRGGENPHTYEPAPDDARAVSKADLLVKVGLGLEEWLDGLVANAGRKKLAVVDVARGVEVISDADEHGHEHGHPAGNPHIWLDPANARAAAFRIAGALSALDSAGASRYRDNATAFARRLDSLTDTLQKLVQTLPDRRIISYHEAWPYFARRFGFEVVAAIEPLPGQEPSARYLAGLVKLVKEKKVRVIVTEPQLPSDVPNALARETGAQVVVLSPLTGALPGTSSYLALISHNVRTLAAALAQ